MGNKDKGSNSERELLHMLWQKGFACVRVAGSGSSTEMACDLLAGNSFEKYAIECKTTKNKKKYFNKEQINELIKLAKIFGLKPVIAVKFSRNNWYFIEPEKLEKTKKGLAISLEDAKNKGFNLLK